MSIQFNFKKSSLIDTIKLDQSLKTLNSYNENIKSLVSNAEYNKNEASLILPFDTSILDDTLSIKKEIKVNSLKFIFVIGIGGPYLGSRAVYEALNNLLPQSNFNKPQIIYVSTLSPELMYEIEDLIINKIITSLDEFLIINISKSGSTTETVANIEVLLAIFSQYFAGFQSRVITISDKNSKLWDIAQQKDGNLIEVPKMVGGRYSVFSPIGILPLSFVCDINEFISGAKDFLERAFNSDISENISALSASLQYQHYLNGIKINNLFFFNSKLEYLGKWYQQLLAESIGKKAKVSGEINFDGITPIVSIGSNDLHSLAQLYIHGPRDKFTNFVEIKLKHKNVKVPQNLYLGEIVESIKGKSLDDILGAIYEGTKGAYEINKLPFVETILDDISEYSLGEFMQFKMLEVMYLANLMNVNAFDQPGVEDYKKVTREILKNNS